MAEFYTTSSSQDVTFRDVGSSALIFQGKVPVQKNLDNLSYGAASEGDRFVAIGGAFNSAGNPCLRSCLSAALDGNFISLDDSTEYVTATFNDGRLSIAQRALSENRPLAFIVKIPTSDGIIQIQAANISRSWKQAEYLRDDLAGVAAVIIAKCARMYPGHLAYLSNTAILEHLGAEDYGYAILWNPTYNLNNQSIPAKITNNAIKENTSVPRHQERSRLRSYLTMGGIALFASVILFLNSYGSEVMAMFRKSSDEAINQTNSKNKITCTISAEGMGAFVRTAPNLEESSKLDGAGVEEGKTIQGVPSSENPSMYEIDPADVTGTVPPGQKVFVSNQVCLTGKVAQ